MTTVGASTTTTTTTIDPLYYSIVPCHSLTNLWTSPLYSTVSAAAVSATKRNSAKRPAAGPLWPRSVPAASDGIRGEELA